MSTETHPCLPLAIANKQSNTHASGDYKRQKSPQLPEHKEKYN